MASKMPNVVLEDIRIMFRNFSGIAGKYNAAGQRNFTVFLTDAVAENMVADGWNIKYLQPREEGDSPQPIIKVTVSFKGRRPPRIVMLTSRGKTPLDESTVNVLDWAEIVKADLIIGPFEWDINGKQGVSAYAQSLYVKIFEDELELKYSDVPDSALSGMTGNHMGEDD